MTARQGSPHDDKPYLSGDQLSQVARILITNRRFRQTLLPADIFGEWAWDALLTLFIADTEGRQLNGQMLAAETACSPKIMERWIQHLLSIDMIVSDGVRDLERPLILSARAITILEEYLSKDVETVRRILDT